MLQSISGASIQDTDVLNRVYSQLKEFNSEIMMSPDLERLAQKTSCVRNHSDHRATDRATLKIYNNSQVIISSIIACVGGCSSGISNWSRDYPATIWKEFEGKTGNYKAILNANVAGCSAAKSGNDICVFCYLARTKNGVSKQKKKENNSKFSVIDWVKVV